MAENFPGAEVIGVDLSPIQPDWCPSNLQFHVDNVEDTWVYGSGYDYVHLRHMAINIKEPAALLTSIYEYAVAYPAVGCRVLTGEKQKHAKWGLDRVSRPPLESLLR